jgi:hypothetical protein
VTVAEFPKDKKGVFNEMLSVGVEIGDLYFPIGTSQISGVVIHLSHIDCLL